MTYVFDPQGVPTVPVAEMEEVFPGHRIYSVGQNYAKHAREMGITVDRVSPFFLTNQPIQYFQETHKFLFLQLLKIYNMRLNWLLQLVEKGMQ